MHTPKPRKSKQLTTWTMIGNLVADHRNDLDLTQVTLAGMCGVSVDTLSSVEQGRRPLQMDLAVLLDKFLGTKRTFQTLAQSMPSRDRLPVFIHDFLDYEQDALTLTSYENQVVPGLLQTEEYARFVFECQYPPLDEDERESWVAARMDRQRLLERKPHPILHFILEESILRSRLGDPAMMRNQIRHLRQCMELPFLGLQIMPIELPKHAALDGPMVLLETPEHDHLAYVEGQLTSYLHEDPDQVSVLLQKCGMLRSQAHSVDASARLMDEMLGET
ncbi:Scr1 family TA system antitoxin-like transcriptional regulator [Streptomyces sp. NPDC092952]|uniref:helix-turn-helix domain-containing protein n=1 Tax=Streptomyces sp. NPDC092952 TaxID=3366018 RepID=UPI0038142BCA